MELVHSQSHTPSNGYSRHQNEIAGRFRKITVVQICMGWWLYRSGQITRRQLRVYFASHEMAERRRYTKSKTPHARYTLGELKNLVGGRGSERADADLSADIRKLSRIGLVLIGEHNITFARSTDDLTIGQTTGFQKLLDAMPHPRRSVPVPRRTLRALAAGFSKATTALVLALMIRSLFWQREKNEFRTDGRTKLSWVAETFEVSRRAATDAHAHLVNMGWLDPLETSQWALNRWGRRDQLNPDWSVVKPIVESGSEHGESASRLPENQGESASPESNPKLSNENLNTRKLEENPSNTRSGIFKISSSASKPAQGHERPQTTSPSPSLQNVSLEDLKDTTRLLDLYAQAMRCKWVQGSEANELAFVALAERALARGQKPGGMFVWFVKSWNTKYITQADEDSAIRRLRAHRNSAIYEDFSEGRAERSRRSEPEFTAEDDIVKSCIQMAKEYLLDDPYVVAREIQGWTRDEWTRKRSTYEIKQARYCEGNVA